MQKLLFFGYFNFNSHAEIIYTMQISNHYLINENVASFADVLRLARNKPKNVWVRG